MVFGGSAIAFSAAGVYALMNLQATTALLLLAIGMINLVCLLREAFISFDFDAAGLTVRYPARKVTYRLDDLTDIRLEQRDLDIALLLVFRKRTVVLSDNQLLMAPEQIYRALLPGWRTTGRRRRGRTRTRRRS